MGDIPTNRPLPAAAGTLAKTPVLHLLVYALEKRLGGTIEFVTPDRRNATVLFVAGEPAKARGGESGPYLGRVLFDLGFLSEEQLTLSLAELARTKAGGRVLHGELLVGKGFIDEDKLRAGLHEQLGRKLRQIASMPPETTYAYYDAFDGLSDWGATDTAAADPLSFLWAMLRESAPQAHLDAALTRVAGSPLRLARSAELARLRLAEPERGSAELLRARPMTAGEFAQVSGLGETNARLLAYLLLVTKQVDVLTANTIPPRAHIPSNPVPVSVSVASANAGPVPVRARSSPSSPSPSRRPPAVPPHSQIPAALAAVARSRPPPSGLSPELAERWTAIVDRAKVIDRADYFAMLELARDATKDEIETAFYGLVRKWHPDRLPAELAPVRDACSRVFSRMTEAHATLTDDDERARYMKLLADGSGSPEMQERVAKILEAAADFQKAEVCFKRHDHVQAEIFCRKAIQEDATQPDYLALLAWLLSLKPEYQPAEKLAECIQMLDKAVALSDHCERGYFWRGQLNKRLGKPDAAVRDFRRAMDLNPRNIDAAREVRLHNMRGGRPPHSSSPPPGPLRSTPLPGKTPKADEKPGSGLLGRFFKK